MDITIRLSPEEEKTLLARASHSGHDLAGYIHLLIERDAERSVALADLLAPIRREFADSGMSEDELDALVEGAREDVWREQQLGPSGSS